MIFILISLIVIVGAIITNYYLDNINNYANNIKSFETFEDIKKCVKETYILNYTDFHISNANNINNLEYRLENTFMKIKNGNTKIYNDKNEILRKGLKITSIDSTEQEILKKFFNEIEQCTENKEFTLYFKNVTYYNNGIIDIPKLNIELLDKTRGLDYDKIQSEIIEDKTIESYGLIDIDDTLNERFRILSKIIDEISVSISQYSFSNLKNKENNLFSFKNGIINVNNTRLGLDSPSIISGIDYNAFAKSNGGQNTYIQSNGLLYLDSYEKYCYNSSNKTFSVFACNDHTTNNPNNFDDTTSDYCSSINGKLFNSDLYYYTSMNERNDDNYVLVASESDFVSNLGIDHVYNVCKSYDNYNDSKVKFYFENLGLNNLIVDKAFHQMFYYIDYDGTEKNLDINNWTDVNENKVFSINKGENGYVVNISNNKDFITNNLNLSLNFYKNPFYPKKEFDFFINNSGYDLLRKMFGKELLNTNIKILKSGNYIVLAMPVTVDIATENIISSSEYSFGNHIYMKFIEGSVQY